MIAVRARKAATTVVLQVLILVFIVGCFLLNSPPTASFTAFPNSGTAPLAVLFDASNSSDTGGIIVGYQWGFGDGTTGSGKTATHTYEFPGEYAAKLTVTDDQGTKDSTLQTIQVGKASLTASFTASPTLGEAPLGVDFDASDSSDPDGEIIRYAWSFGDGSTGAGVTVRHTYYTPGIYSVVLTVTNDNSYEDQATMTIAVSEAPRPGNTKPTASFTAAPASGEAPLAVNFNASGSSDSDGHITSYQWTFGNGNNGSGKTTSHTYADSGTYEVWLMVTDNNGATDTATCTIQVSAAPVANSPPTASFTATPSLGEAPLAVNFDASASFDSDGSIVSYSWSFGDGGSSSGVTTTHTYTSAGTYTAQLTVTDDDGSTDSATRTIQVSAAPIANNPPVASFTASPTSGQAALAVSFNASGSSDSDGSIVSYSWSFGDGGSSSGVTTTHTYTSAGTYTAQLTVTDDDGATDTAIRTIQVSSTPIANNPPVASFTSSPTSGQAALAVSFNASGSSDSDGSITSYAWTFGDGGSSSGVTASHTYNSAGTYTAQLTVTDDDGATNTATRTIQVSAAPVANTPPTASFTATPSSGEAPLAVTFNASASFDPDGSITSYAWDFGEGREIGIRGSGEVRISDCHITGELRVFQGTVSVLIKNNELLDTVRIEDKASGYIEGNVFSGWFADLIATGVARVTIRGNIFQSGAEIALHGQAHAVILDNSIENIYDPMQAIVVNDSAEALIQGNHITCSIGIWVRDTAVVDLGGGLLGSAGGNTLSTTYHTPHYNIKDERLVYSGLLSAKNNTWDDPQPTGTVEGPADNAPNYYIENEGNSIVFSD